MKKKGTTRENNLISIIVPVFNAKMYIERCVKSICRQTYSKIEIILVDDGSTDGSSDFCDQIKKKDQRIKVLHCKNGGAASARNHGLDIARGEYIMFIDSDDYVNLELCQNLINNMKLYHSECCICGYQIIEESKEGLCISANEKVIFSGREAIFRRYIKEESYVNIVNPWGKLYHWSMWENLRFTSGMYYEDLDVMPYLYLNCKKIVCIPDVGYYYVQRLGSCSNGIDTDDKRYIDSLAIRKKHVSFFKQNGELELAYAIMQKAIDLIITSDCRGWIPVAYKDESKQVFYSYVKELITKGKITGKNKIRYLLYGWLGKKIYKICTIGFIYKN